MLEDMIRSPEEFSIEDYLSNRITDQILNLDYEGDFFEDTINTTNVPSTANDVPSISVMAAADVAVTESSPPNHSVAVLPCYDPYVDSTYSSYDSSEFLSALLDPQPPPELEPDILTSFSDVPMAPFYSTNQNQLNQMICPGPYAPYSPNSVVRQIPLDMPPYLEMEPSTLRPCAYIDPNGGGIAGEIYGDGMGVSTWEPDGQLGFFAGGAMAMGPSEAFETCSLGIYTPGSMQRVYAPRDVQVLGDNQCMMAGCSGSADPLQVASDIPTLEDSSFKVGRLSEEERKEKIHKYLKKRNQRNFNKKIKYECRKTLADKRPRVRGRFAKNNELNEAAPRPNSANHEYDENEKMARRRKI